MAKELWGSVDGVSVKSAKFGKGTIMSGISLEEAFAIVNSIPDCKIVDGAPPLYGHRTLDNGEIYFVSNQSDKQQATTLEFRVKGLQPELWDATSGSRRNLPAYMQEKESTAVPIKLEPFGSAFIVFRKSGKPKTNSLEANYPNA